MPGSAAQRELQMSMSPAGGSSAMSMSPRQQAALVTDPHPGSPMPFATAGIQPQPLVPVTNSGWPSMLVAGSRHPTFDDITLLNESFLSSTGGTITGNIILDPDTGTASNIFGAGASIGSNAQGTSINLVAGSGSDPGTKGGNMDVEAGGGGPTGNGGDTFIVGGAGGLTSGNGGLFDARGGPAFMVGNGGNAQLTGGRGNGAGNKAGNVVISGGQGGSGAASGYVIISNLPTAATGLPSGALWINSGVLNIVP